ncbi:MAG TPA: cupin domain-containing protein [Gaiellaceae bacterium]|nr:cupin domain-containing protein [Gaiellaceae bacterium]
MTGFRTWNGVERWEIFPGVSLHAIGGEQVFLGHVTYAPGTTVARHAHPEAEQVMWIVEGSMRMTVGDETAELGPGDVVVVNRGIEHELVSEGGVTFVEAMSPVPRDHIPDPKRDLVLGEQGASLHVAR